MSVSVSQCLPGQSHQRSTHLKWVHRPQPLHCRIHRSAPNWGQRPCHLTSRLWLRPDHEMHSASSWIILMQGILRKLEFKKTDLKVFGKHWSSLKNVSGAAVSQSKMDTTWYDPRIKRAQMCSNIICDIYTYPLTVFETGSKNLSKTTPNKINPLGLDVFDTDVAVLQIQMPDRSIDLQHLSQFLAECNCARQLFDFTDGSHRNIYSHWTQVHHTSAPSSQQILNPKLISTTVLLDCKAVAKAWPTWKTFRAQSKFYACCKSAKFYALISECLDLKDSSKRSFLSTNQNRCKFLEDQSHDAKIEMS